MTQPHFDRCACGKGKHVTAEMCGECNHKRAIRSLNSADGPAEIAKPTRAYPEGADDDLALRINRAARIAAMKAGLDADPAIGFHVLQYGAATVRERMGRGV